MTSIVATGFADAPIHTVWAVLADAKQYRTWAAPRSSSLEREGSPTPDGVGAVRRFGTAGVMSREEVVVFDPSHRLSYVLLSGLPVVNYRADVDLTEANGGTDIRWSSSYEVRRRWMSAPMRVFLTYVLNDFIRRLAKEARRKADRP